MSFAKWRPFCLGLNVLCQALTHHFNLILPLAQTYCTCIVYFLVKIDGMVADTSTKLSIIIKIVRWISGTKASDAELWCFFDLRPDKLWSKQSWGWWLETPSHPLWRHRNDVYSIMELPTPYCVVLGCDIFNFLPKIVLDLCYSEHRIFVVTHSAFWSFFVRLHQLSY